MAFTLRQDAILKAVRRDGSVRVAEISAELGVSQMTVRRDITVLADQGLVTRVHGGATLPRYKAKRTPAAAPQPERGRNLSLSMMVPAASYYYRQVIQGAQAAAEILGARLTLGISCYDPKEDRLQVERLVESRPHGLLLTPSTQSPKTGEWASWLSELPCPVIIVERLHDPALDLDFADYVGSDHLRGTLQALRHLTEIGHHRIALLTSETATSPSICRGFDLASHLLDLPPDVPRATGQPHDSIEHVDAFLDSALASGATALVAHPDQQAALVMQRARLRGLTVPDDLAIVAYDDEFAALADIPLTAVAPPRQAVGRTAVMVMAQRLREGDAHVPRQTLLLPRLHVRASTVM
ncbi:LacI family DNA-binding transcriptional regulator [Micromonospora sp. LZ34]